MDDTNKKFCSIIFDVLSAHGVKDTVCSPGSRNVPLLLAAAARDEIRKHFIVDERSAAFFALGLAEVSQQPVVLICTSGTALLNYAPAIAEAYYQNIPLIILSADRPIQWIDQDDSQTLRQDNALDNYLKKSYSIPAGNDEIKELQWYVNRITNDAFITAMSGAKGPVHINIHLDEPLGVKTGRSCNPVRLVESLNSDTFGNKEIFKSLAQELVNSRIMLVAGFGMPDSGLQKAVADFSRWPNVAVMAETISNLHLNLEDYRVDSVLTAFPAETLYNEAPDIIISIGGALVSRKLKEYLRRNSERCIHWKVGYSHTTTDPFMNLGLRLEIDPIRFFRSINEAVRKIGISPSTSYYKDNWHHLRKLAAEAKDRYIHSCNWSELKAFSVMLNQIPSDYNVFLSNGTTVRYAQIISHRLPHATFCNRGVSGIDGSVSTSIGGAIAYKGKSLLITGDLSLIYDIGAFNIKEIPSNFKIIVIDNQGGSIFRFIPSTSNLEEREEYLCQTPDFPWHNFAVGFGWKYFEADTEESLNKIIPGFFHDKERCLLRIQCDGISSAEILKEYMETRINRCE